MRIFIVTNKFYNNILLFSNMVTPPSLVVNGYRKITQIGEGAFGEAHLIENVITKKQFVMKIVGKAQL